MPAGPVSPGNEDDARATSGVTPAAIPAGQRTSGLCVIVKLDEKRPTKVPKFDEAKGTIRQQLQALEKAAAQLFGDLLKGATIQQ
ncbi:hypothetical protein P3T23_009321 [Paraburkholderia sp. GAS448]|uniref:peptidylprolyl isomerase n=1 Tax=Paraburkholderia sp. GAS448 TaxID=3035136 RepID=UPI003D201186